MQPPAGSRDSAPGEGLGGGASRKILTNFTKFWPPEMSSSLKKLKCENCLSHFFKHMFKYLHSVFFIRNLKLRLPKNFLIFEQNLAKNFLKIS